MVVELNTLTAHITKNPDLLGQVGKELSDYYSMVVHGENAYDLNRRLKGNSRYKEESRADKDLKILKMLDGLPDV